MTRAGIRIGYQGEPGAYGEAAARLHAGERAGLVPVRGFAGLLGALARGEIERAVLPVENTIVGAVRPALEALLATGGVAVAGEVTVPVEHCLLARPGATRDALRRVLSHPVALAQCGGFLARHPHLAAEGVGDTGGAARIVRESGDATLAAIASRAAAACHGLAVLEAGVQDRGDNATRFWVVEPRGTIDAGRGPARGVVVRSALLVTPAAGAGAAELARLVAALAGVGEDVRGFDTRVGSAGPWVVELTHRAGPPDPATVLARSRWGVRALGRWELGGTAGRRDGGNAAPVPWAVRGATTVAADTKAELHAATRELLAELLARNAITADDVVSAVFTVTPDLTSDFPATAARAMGWTDVPLLSASEIAVAGALPRCIRVLLQVHTPPPVGGVRHAYLGEATRLRPDWVEG
ncbi:MAG TPA: chorismate mutase [Gemmatimonadaceae bacterium]|nr:chorismate mutase [Gemmatimonadaceae bacterium]